MIITLAAMASGCAGDGASTQTASEAPVYQTADGQTLDTQSPVAIPNAGNLTGDSGSVVFDLTPGWNGGDDSAASLLDLGTPGQAQTNRLQLFKTGASLRFMMWDSAGKETGVAFTIEDWQPGEPHPVAVTWGEDESGQRQIQLFVDGQLVGAQPYENDFDVPNGQPLIIGNNAGGNVGARGELNSFQVYNAVLDADRIAQLELK